MTDKKYEYPLQIMAIKRTQKVLGVDAKLYLPSETDLVPPLQMHSGFSRMELTIVDKKLNSAPTANIPADEISYIHKKTDIVLEELTKNKLVSTTSVVPEVPTENADSPAYKVKLMDKDLKGMTPAQVLISNPESKSKLLSVKQWLSNNLEKYPNNRLQIEAIDDAIKLLEIGELSVSSKECETISSSRETEDSMFEIYHSDYKFKSKHNDKGEHLIYAISVTCEPNKNYPFTVSIMNCYAPVTAEANGQRKIKMSAATGTIKSFLSMTEKEWYSLISKMDKAVINFENVNYKKQLEIAEANSYKFK